MQAMIIEGGRRLSGSVRVSGAKNAALPIMAAAILSEESSTILNVPPLMDVATMRHILDTLGVETELASGGLTITPVDESRVTAPYELVSTMRASVCVLGPLLGRRRKAKVSLPGGCVIGSRPIDLHLKGLRALGADIDVKHGYIEARADRLKGANVSLRGPAGSSVLATINVMSAAVLAEGETVIDDAALEPEVTDTARFLSAMGARIEGAGTSRIVIRGVDCLHGAKHEIIGDRIEAGTMMCAAAVTGGEVEIFGAAWEHIAATVDILRRMGVDVEQKGDGCVVSCENRPKAMDVATAPFPDFPTDMQAQVMAVLAVADGSSRVTETVFPERFMHVGELNRMGADITKEGPTSVIRGVEHLTGAQVMASDLRASAALIVAALAAWNTTTIERIYHLHRGYDRIQKKLSALGAQIRLSD